MIKTKLFHCSIAQLLRKNNNGTMKQSNNRNIYRGFTLIELLVVTAIILVIIGAVSNSFFSSLRGSTKTTVMNEAKQNGDYALSVMERMIRNAVDVTSSCVGDALDSLTITNLDGGSTTFVCPSSPEVRIASLSGLLETPSYLTSEKIQVLESGCEFICSQTSSISSKIVKIKFTIQQLTTIPGITPRPEDQTRIDFETSIVIRNTAF